MSAVIDGQLKRRGSWRRKPFNRAELHGYFLVSAGGNSIRCRGRLRAGALGSIEVYVEDPPRRGGYVHQPCLQLLQGRWFRLHFERPPRSFDAAIVFTEHYLACCLAGEEID